jgi:hypothetical protein
MSGLAGRELPPMASKYAVSDGSDDEKPLILHGPTPTTPLLGSNKSCMGTVKSFLRENWVILLLTGLVRFGIASKGRHLISRFGR